MRSSVAQGARGSGLADAFDTFLERLPALAIGAVIVGAALAAYWLPGTDRCYNHFVWQAVAFLDGQASIPWPVAGPFCSGTSNDWMQDVYPLVDASGARTGRALLPFPPLPAIVLVPFAALWGLGTDIRAASVVLGALAVGLCWWAVGQLRIGRLRIPRRISIAVTVLLGFGTVFWYAAQLGTTWFFAHVVAVTFLLLAVGVAVGADPSAGEEEAAAPTSRTLLAGALADLRRPLSLVDRRQLLAGLLFGLACTARLSIVFGAPFLMLVGGGGSWLRRSVSAGIGVAIPVGLLVAYNLATTGHVVHPGYEYQYLLEAYGYPGLHYNPAWSIEDIRYIPQNLGIMFLSLPVLNPEHVPNAVITGRELCTIPGAVRGLFDPQCPIALPSDVGMSILLTTPAYLLALPAVLRPRCRLIVGALVATVAIAIFNLAHFSQGWVQFGYRFSNDFVVFALLLVAAALARRGRVGALAWLLIGASMAINLWGVIWGNILGW